MMDLSLNEAESLACKAARGAGHDWGIAQEAGRAIRWLSARGVPALDALDGLLMDVTQPPSLQENTLKAAGTLCPLRAGAAASDLATVADFDGLQLLNLHTPLLLLPFAAAAARALGCTIRLDGTVQALTDGITLAARGDWRAVADVALTPCTTPLAPKASHHRAPVAPKVHARLDALAQHTYAPATEASRRLGAGP